MRLGNPFLSVAAPLLILVAIFGFFHRDGSDRVQALPAVFVGVGLIVTGSIRRGRRRKMLYAEIKQSKYEKTS